MSKFADRFRTQRAASRRHRAIAQALAKANSPALRDEINAIANRAF